MRPSLVFCMFALVHGGPSPGAEFHVAPSGNDAADGSETAPWRTMRRAMEAAGPGVTVTAAAGIYRESVVVAGPGGSEGRPFVLRSAAGERAILDGGWEQKTGVLVRTSHVAIRGLEIRNYRENGIWVWGRHADNVVVERNVIHHISNSLSDTGKGGGCRGIWAVGVSDCTIRQNTVYLVVGHNESFGVLFDVSSRYRKPIRGALIEKNLFYLIDKSAVRIVDNSHPDRCHVLAEPAYIRGNIAVHIGYVGLEINYMNTAATEEGPLNGEPGEPIHVEDNFVGWCASYGVNPKQSADGCTRHNTVVATHWIGYLQSGGDSYRMRIEANLLADNVVGSMVHRVGEDNRFIGNYYRQPAAWPDFFWDRTNGWGTTYTSIEDLRGRSSLSGVEEHGVLGGPNRLFRRPEDGDYRLIPESSAVGAAPDGQDFGVREAMLADVGASGDWGLSAIPVIPEVKGMRVVAFSSEDPGPCPLNPDQHYSARSTGVDAASVAAGPATHVVDGTLSACWRPKGGTLPAWVVIDLPGEEPIRLGAFSVGVCHTGREEICHPRGLRLSVRVSPDDPWQEVGTYTRHRRGAGRIFPITGTPKARQVKLDVLSNHGSGEAAEVAEFRLYRSFSPIE